MKKSLLFFALLVISFCFTISATAKDISFGAPIDYPVMEGISAIAAADFNGDGKMDLASVSDEPSGHYTDSVSIRLNVGNGLFGPAISYPTSNSPSSLCAADFDGDGKIDLAVASAWWGYINIFKGNGDGTLTFVGTYAGGTTSQSLSICTTDLNGDGKPDLAVTNPNAHFVTTLLNTGNCTFGAEMHYGQVGLPDHIFPADFDGDGKGDLVMIRDMEAFVFILLGKGNGTVWEANSNWVHKRAEDVCAADFNNDGKPDVAVTTTSDSITILLNSGGGVLASPKKYLLGGNPWLIRAADFDQDGWQDLIVLDNNGWPQFSIMRNTGQGSFDANTTVLLHGSVDAICIADFDGNGLCDVAVSNRMAHPDSIAVYLNQTALAVEEIGGPLPTQFALSQNYPNPFNPTTTITYSIPKATDVFLVVYNIIGQEVARLVDAHQHAGNYAVSWDATDQPSGVYLYRLQTGQADETRKMLILK